jgi:hypothetical protein
VFSRWSALRLIGNCVITSLYNIRGTVFSVLRGPCRGNIREPNSEASSCTSTEEYKEYNREYERELMEYNGVVGRR